MALKAGSSVKVSRSGRAPGADLFSQGAQRRPGIGVRVPTVMGVHLVRGRPVAGSCPTNMRLSYSSDQADKRDSLNVAGAEADRGRGAGGVKAAPSFDTPPGDKGGAATGTVLSWTISSCLNHCRGN